ncbi:conserved hypothetical protein [Ricinus communis]|uniref:Uncharacterized protein n=1 Tax=Ricinus communis TaxID=3988 RepID=B9SMI1_RICCO|nr:conserved hypothetical protein [Ricinus communis]
MPNGGGGADERNSEGVTKLRHRLKGRGRSGQCLFSSIGDEGEGGFHSNGMILKKEAINQKD